MNINSLIKHRIYKYYNIIFIYKHKKLLLIETFKMIYTFIGLSLNTLELLTIMVGMVAGVYIGIKFFNFNNF